ncbi:MAG: FAD-dependent oxidoreductase [Homoserinimonas sp.]
MTRRDVMVVGGGLIGLATAWRAAREGMRVTVVSDAARATASRAAVGGLSFCPADAVLTGHRATIELSAIARAGFGAYVSKLEKASGVPTRFRRQATLMGQLRQPDAGLIDRVEAARRLVGLESLRLTGDECREREPGMSEEVTAGLLIEDHEQIDARAFTDSLWAACVNSGVEFVWGIVAGIVSSSGRATGVCLESGEVREADHVVVAAGSWSSAIDGLPEELRHAVRPLSGQTVIVRLADGMEAPRHDLRSAGVYMVSRSDRTIVLGATKVDRGFDQAPTASAVLSLVSAAAQLWSPVLDCEWQETTVGLRPQSRDGLPIVGPTSLPGLHVATAHFRNGLMFGPASADAVIDGILGGTPREQFEAFSPLREVIR